MSALLYFVERIGTVISLTFTPEADFFSATVRMCTPFNTGTLEGLKNNHQETFGALLSVDDNIISGDDLKRAVEE